MQRRVERSLGDLDHVAGNLLQALRDGIAVHRAKRDNFQDQQVQGALGQIGFRVHCDTSYFYLSST